MQLTFVRSDVWEGIYVDDSIMMEGYQIGAGDLLDVIADNWKRGDGFHHTTLLVDNEWADQQRRFPDNLSDIPADVIKNMMIYNRG